MRIPERKKNHWPTGLDCPAGIELSPVHNNAIMDHTQIYVYTMYIILCIIHICVKASSSQNFTANLGNVS